MGGHVNQAAFAEFAFREVAQANLHFSLAWAKAFLLATSMLATAGKWTA